MLKKYCLLQMNKTSIKSKANLLSIVAPSVSAINNSLTYNIIFEKNT